MYTPSTRVPPQIPDVFMSRFAEHIWNKTASVVWWSEFLATDVEVRVRLSALPDFQSSSGSGTGSTQPREYN
jgi:hypothetical protein